MLSLSNFSHKILHEANTIRYHPISIEGSMV